MIFQGSERRVTELFDLHYDLLTYIYVNKNNIEKIKKHCKKIFKNNDYGGIFNLFYMSKKEMKEELNINEEEIDIIKNLEKAKKTIQEEKLIPNNVRYIFGIEGLDYLQKIEDIDILYENGVRSVNPVWSNSNKFGGGIRNENQGLTNLGKKLIYKLIEKEIAIDLSHANKKTFWDVIKICEDLKSYNPKVMASHSNSKEICDVPRNLEDSQIIAIKDLGGIIGAVSIKNFCKDTKNLNEEFEKEYIKHINHIKYILGGVDNIGVATDDMSYYEIDPEYYKNLNIYKLENISLQLQKLLIRNGYTESETEKILYKNAERILL